MDICFRKKAQGLSKIEIKFGMNFVDLAPIIIASPSIGRAQGGFVEDQGRVGAWMMKVV